MSSGRGVRGGFGSLSAGDLCEADLHRAMATSASFVSQVGVFS